MPTAACCWNSWATSGRGSRPRFPGCFRRIAMRPFRFSRPLRRRRAERRRASRTSPRRRFPRRSVAERDFSPVRRSSWRIRGEASTPAPWPGGSSRPCSGRPSRPTPRRRARRERRACRRAGSRRGWPGRSIPPRGRPTTTLRAGRGRARACPRFRISPARIPRGRTPIRRSPPSSCRGGSRFRTRPGAGPRCAGASPPANRGRRIFSSPPVPGRTPRRPTRTGMRGSFRAAGWC